MTEKSWAERRDSPRQPLVLQVAYSDRGRFLGDWTENVSMGGLFVRSDEPFAMGDPVTLSLSFPGLLERTVVSGTVAWIRPASGELPRGVGVRVDDPNHKRRLAELALLAGMQADGPYEDFEVLVVDDNPHIGKIYERVLRRIAEGSGGRITVRFAANGHEALGELRKRTADMLITDLYMPVMDGITLVGEIQNSKAHPNMAILLATSADVEQETRLDGLRVDAVARKPLQLGQLLETVVCLLRRGT
jgi:uncharacterized protein (TIGR02266 family)